MSPDVKRVEDPWARLINAVRDLKANKAALPTPERCYPEELSPEPPTADVRQALDLAREVYGAVLARLPVEARPQKRSTPLRTGKEI
jgi:hypothetical protein